MRQPAIVGRAVKREARRIRRSSDALHQPPSHIRIRRSAPLLAERRAPAPRSRRTPRYRRLRSLLDEYLRQLLAQRHHPGANPRLDGAERQLEALGQLGLRQPEKVRLLDQHTLIRRQRLERARDGALLFADAGARLGALRRLRQRRRLRPRAAARCWRAADRSRGCARSAPATPPAGRARRCRSRPASRPGRTLPAGSPPPRCDRG